MTKSGTSDAHKIDRHDVTALARLITRVESRAPGHKELLAAAHQKRTGARIVGMTGPPGAGKSTLVDQLIAALRAKGQSVAVLAVDPSSPFSGGAVLGDRIRMQRHALDAEVFIRSLGSRGRHGGLSRATRDICTILDAAGFDAILIETVGVGQTELDVMRLADTTVVMLVPEAGDSVQTLKAGLLEIADIFVVNKADRDGADRMIGDLKALVMMRGVRDGWDSPVLSTVATQGQGVVELMRSIDDHAAHRRAVPDRVRRNPKETVIEIALESLEDDLRETIRTDDAAIGILGQVESGSLNPYTGAEELIRVKGWKIGPR